MCSAELQIHWREGSGSDVNLRTRDVQGPRCRCTAVTGKTYQASVGFENLSCQDILYIDCCLFLFQAAMDFLVEENLKARVSCWYIQKYIEEHPLQHFKDLVITWLKLICLLEPELLPQINYNLMYPSVRHYRGQRENVKHLQHLSCSCEWQLFVWGTVWFI